jgi:cytochrome c-type biogenesis protein CcmH
MSIFWIASAGLCLLAAVLVLIPLRIASRRAAVDDVRREENLNSYRQLVQELETARASGAVDETEYAQARSELDRRVLEETDVSAPLPVRESGRAAVWACALAIPVLAIVLYQQLGASDRIRLDAMLKQFDGDAAADDGALERMLPLLERAARGDDPDGEYRFLLARMHGAAGRFPEAAALYAELVQLYPEDAALMAQQAQALYMAAGREVTPGVQALLDQALAIDPAQVTLLGMLGMDRFQAGDYRGAIDNWQKLLDKLPANAPDAQVIRDGIAMARSRLGEGEGDASASAATAEAATATPGTETPAGAGPRLLVSVSVAQGLELRPDDTVFVFARAVDGPPAPLAVARFAASELPRVVELSDAMAMAPGLTLSTFPMVDVVARVSRQGGVSAQPGDLEGSLGGVSVAGGEQALTVEIDRRI